MSFYHTPPQNHKHNRVSVTVSKSIIQWHFKITVDTHGCHRHIADLQGCHLSVIFPL